VAIGSRNPTHGATKIPRLIYRNTWFIGTCVTPLTNTHSRANIVHHILIRIRNKTNHIICVYHNLFNAFGLNINPETGTCITIFHSNQEQKKYKITLIRVMQCHLLFLWKTELDFKINNSYFNTFRKLFWVFGRFIILDHSYQVVCISKG